MGFTARKASNVLPILLLFSAVFVGATDSALAKTCTSAEIDEAFRLPDGSTHAAGKLTLCRESNLNPVTSLHVSYIDRMPTGIVLARRSVRSISDATEASMWFVRDADGMLTLHAYSLPSRNGFEDFVLVGPGQRPSSDANPATLASLTPSEGIVQVASLTPVAPEL